MGEPDGTRRVWRRRAENEPGGRQFRHEVKVTAEEEARLVVLSKRQRVTIPRLLVSSALSRDTARITVEQQRELLTEFKRMCGTGGALKDGVIEIQGDHRDTLLEALKKRGINAKKAGG